MERGGWNSLENISALEERARRAELSELASGTLVLIKQLRYLNGCVARGRGSDIDQNSMGNNIFKYIKELERKAGVAVRPKREAMNERGI